MRFEILFRDRSDAGRQLAAKLKAYAGRPDVVVLALPRGGVPVAFEAAKALRVPLDVFLVRKLGVPGHDVPGHEELAMGAIATGSVRVLNDSVVSMLNIPDDVIGAVTQKEIRELERRERLYRGKRPPTDIRGKTAILIDDGLATGSTMRAALAALRRLEPARIVVAVPVGAIETCAEFQNEADEAICACTPEPFYAVGVWYGDFTPTTDEEIQELLEQARQQIPLAKSNAAM